MERMQNCKDAVQDTIARYVYQVTRRLPGRARKDIEAELCGLIEDMLETRCGESAPTEEDLAAVLTELGSPAAFAAQYGSAEGRPRYLIGPDMFPQYLTVLKLVLLAVSIGMVVVSLLQSFVEPNALTGFALAGAWIGNIVSGLFPAAAAVTLLFAIFEWRGVKMDAMDADWLKELPPVPREESRIPRGDCIGGIVFSSLALLLLVAAPQYIAVLVEGTSIPVFNLALYQKLLPLIVAGCALGVCKEVAKLLEGRYTMRLAIGMTVADLISIVLCIVVLSQPIWNRSLLIVLNRTVDLSDAGFLSGLWNAFGQVVLGVVFFGHVGDLISLWVRTLKARRAEA